MPNNKRSRTARRAAVYSRRMDMDVPPALVLVRKISGNPPPITNAARYTKRTVQLNTTSGAVTDGAISNALGRSGDYIIDHVDMWTLVLSGTTFATGSFTAKTRELLSGVPSSSDDVVVVDHGTGASRPCVRFMIPRSRAQIFNYNTGGATTLFTCSGDAVVHVTVWQYAS